MQVSFLAFFIQNWHVALHLLDFFLYFWIMISYSFLYSLAMGWKEVNLWSLIFFQKHQKIEKCCISWNRLLAKYIAFQHFKKKRNSTAKSRILCWRSWVLKSQDLEVNGPKSGASESHFLLLDYIILLMSFSPW